MRVLTYRVTLEEPVLVTALGGEPNGATTLAYLPGSVLRGAAVGKLLQARGLAELDAAAEEARRLFFAGATRYLNGYLEVEGGRCLPVPLSWHREKNQNSPLSDFAVEPPGPTDKKEWKIPGGDFWAPAGEEQVRLVGPERAVQVHTQRNRRLGRAQERGRVRQGEDAGAVYRYVALAPGQTFVAAVLCDHDPDADLLAPLLDGPAWLGGARSAGYGRARLHDPTEDPGWSETGSEPEPAQGGRLTVTLLSDALVRDRWGQLVSDPGVVCQVVAEQLGLPELELKDAYLREHLVGGFNRKWGLPLPQAQAVAMGSVFVFAGADVSPDRLRDLAEQGMGERRAEGFGRVAVNAHRQPQWVVLPDEGPGSVRRVSLAPGSEAAAVARRMAERLLRRRLDSALAARAADLGPVIRHPRRSQLSRLRLVVQDCLPLAPGEGRVRLDGYLTDLHARQVTRRQFTRDRVAGRPLLGWIRQRITDTSEIWNELDARGTPRVGGQAADLSAELAYEYNLRLLDAVLARAARELGKEDH